MSNFTIKGEIRFASEVIFDSEVHFVSEIAFGSDGRIFSTCLKKLSQHWKRSFQLHCSLQTKFAFFTIDKATHLNNLQPYNLPC